MTHAEAEEQMDTLIGAVAIKYTSSAETDQPELLSRILQCVQDHFANTISMFPVPPICWG